MKKLTQRNVKHLIVLLIGSVVLLFGLIFFREEDRGFLKLIHFVCSSVGASIVAAAIVSWLSESGDELPMIAIWESLSESVVLRRSNQEVELALDVVGNFVKVTTRHSFQYLNSSGRPKSKRISMFTDSTRWTGHDEHGGFVVVMEPDGTQLEGEALQQYVTSAGGKTYFTKSYLLSPGLNNLMEFQTHEIYRRLDRIVWTVQDLSEGFRVRIVNRTQVKNAITVKINHHREQEIKETVKKRSNRDGHEEVAFEFTSQLLPYQGFEVMWRIGVREPRPGDST